jgi:hypothetical protein
VEDNRVVLALLGGMLVMLGGALTGHEQIFAYGMVAVLGFLMAIGFVRRRAPVTWAPPAAAVLALLIALTGMFATRSAEVTSSADTVGGFHPGTAFLVFGLWIPAFLTLGVGFALVFDHLSDDDARDDGERPA